MNNYETINVTLEEGVARIELDRLAKHNTFNSDMFEEFSDAVRSIDRDASARAIVISSQGKYFTAGIDLGIFATMAQNGDESDSARIAQIRRQWVLDLQPALSIIEKIRIPVIAAIQGGCIGLGVDLACACDFRYCTADAYFSVRETKMGITADGGTLQRLPHTMHQGLARELCFTGRDMGAEEAHNSGFITTVFDSQDAMIEGAVNTARLVGKNSPMAVTGVKQMLNYARDHTVEEGLEYVAMWQAGMFSLPDVMESMSALQQKREPAY